MNEFIEKTVFPALTTLALATAAPAFAKADQEKKISPPITNVSDETRVNTFPFINTALDSWKCSDTHDVVSCETLKQSIINNCNGIPVEDKEKKTIPVNNDSIDTIRDYTFSAFLLTEVNGGVTPDELKRAHYAIEEVKSTYNAIELGKFPDSDTWSMGGNININTGVVQSTMTRTNKENPKNWTRTNMCVDAQNTMHTRTMKSTDLPITYTPHCLGDSNEKPE